ncbi:spike glycoprotein [Striga asiatica]|uniref:Spike glycoprotein n=1 Tax=Striga asiatica TaxID=4170 RepID=A0A5A7QZH4_STRAF|nr:spike glycoprotein [Striga asiatica]
MAAASLSLSSSGFVLIIKGRVTTFSLLSPSSFKENMKLNIIHTVDLNGQLRILSREWFEPPLLKDGMVLNGVVDRGLNSLHRATIFLGSQSQEVHPGPGQDTDSPLDFHKLISVTLL